MHAHARALLIGLIAVFPGVQASQSQTIDAGAIFRVFLKTGQGLPSYGESAIMGDRVVFTLVVGAADSRSGLQLMSLPAAAVDVDRTRRYARALRAKHYAATRGEVDYAAMTQEVQRTLAQITGIQDPKRRLEMAKEAERRLLSWAEGTYGYRAKNVREMITLFDEAINELRVAAGERQIAIDLRSSDLDAPEEPILAAPTLGESINLALMAARSADTDDERAAILRMAAGLVAGDASHRDLHALVARELDRDAEVAASYAALATEARARAEQASKRADPAGVEAAIAMLRERDQALGARRQPTIEALVGELTAVLETTRVHRARLDRYALVRRSLLEYERTVRPVMSGFDGLVPIISAIRDVKFTAYERLERATWRLASLTEAVKPIAVPPDLADVHASFESALQMATYAVARRKLAVSTLNATMDREASAAAAGAVMLAESAREQLVVRLYPPKLK